MEPVKIAVLDFETEMIGNYGDRTPRPIELGVALFDGPELVDSKGWLINPERALMQRPLALNNLSDKDLEKAITFPGIMDEVLGYVGKRQLAAWPASFEWGVIEAECHRWEVSNPFNYRMLCLRSATQAMLELLAVKLDGNSFEKCYRAYTGVDGFKMQHRGVPDAEIEGFLYWKVRQDLEARISR